MTGKKARKPIIEVSDSNEEVKKIDTSYDDLYTYQKKLKLNVRLNLKRSERS